MYFLAERTVCVHLYPTLYMTKLQRGCFGESKGYYGCEPTTTQQALQREGFLQSLLTVLVHAHAQAQRLKAASDTRSNREILCVAHPGGASPSCTAPRRSLQGKQMLQQPLLQPQGCVTVFVFLWFPPGLMCCC